MATIPQVAKQSGLSVDNEENYAIPLNPNRPNKTLDDLLELGRVQEAREELERLLLEGVDSGDGILVTPEFWDRLRAEARAESSSVRE